MVNTNTKTKREVVIWVILVLISMAAALVITVVIEKLNNPLGDESDFGWQPNFRQVLLALGYEFFIMFLKILVVLGIGRVIFLFSSNRMRIKNAP